MASSSQQIQNTKEIVEANDVDLLVTSSASDILVAVKNLTASRTISLPMATTGYRQITVKDQSNSAGINTITINVDGGATIDSGPPVVININNGVQHFYMNDFAWFTE